MGNNGSTSALGVTEREFRPPSNERALALYKCNYAQTIAVLLAPSHSGHSVVHRNDNSHSKYTTSLRTGVKGKCAEVRLTSHFTSQLLYKSF